jgi:hypothetical protein
VSPEPRLLCEDVAERLPWLLNGTLAAEEAESMRGHLASCAACRRELGETRWAAALFGTHVPTDVLIALAWRKAEPSAALEVARRHIDRCPTCAEELTLARESGDLESSPEIADWRERLARSPRSLPYGVLAIALVVGIGLGLLPRAFGKEPVPTESDVDRELSAARVRLLERELAEARRSEAAPQVNLPIVELAPYLIDGPLKSVAVPPEARLIVIVLGPAPGNGAAAVEIRRADGSAIWQGGALHADASGRRTLGVPTSLLLDGEHEVVLRRAQGEPVRYLVRITRSR